VPCRHPHRQCGEKSPVDRSATDRPVASRLACPLRFTNVIESSYMPRHPLSIGSDAVEQATMAAILAAVGRNPLNEKEVLHSAKMPAIVAPLHAAPHRLERKRCTR